MSLLVWRLNWVRVPVLLKLWLSNVLDIVFWNCQTVPLLNYFRRYRVTDLLPVNMHRVVSTWGATRYRAVVGRCRGARAVLASKRVRRMFWPDHTACTEAFRWRLAWCLACVRLATRTFVRSMLGESARINPFEHIYLQLWVEEPFAILLNQLSLEFDLFRLCDLIGLTLLG